MNKAAYSIASAAELYDVSPDTIRTAIHTTKAGGPIPPLAAKKVGQKYSIPAAALAEWHAALPDA
jgi:hypothetical protein